MLIEKKENYTFISSDENSFTEFYTSFLEAEKKLKNEHIIIQISKNCTKENLLLFIDISTKKKENNTSFVIVNKNISADNFPEFFNIVPTLQEAEDVIEMEAIERELGF